MKDVQGTLIEVQKILHSVMESKRLSTVIKMMAREIARLHEENIQLRAAVATYRETVRRYAYEFGELH